MTTVAFRHWDTQPLSVTFELVPDPEMVDFVLTGSNVSARLALPDGSWSWDCTTTLGLNPDTENQTVIVYCPGPIPVGDVHLQLSIANRLSDIVHILVSPSVADATPGPAPDVVAPSPTPPEG